jgi:hypothetical protein
MVVYIQLTTIIFAIFIKEVVQSWNDGRRESLLEEFDIFTEAVFTLAGD